MNLGELAGNLQYLARDPRSWLHAEYVGWSKPVSLEWAALADLIDVQMISKSKRRPKPYERPWKTDKRIGGKKAVRRSAAEVLALLRPTKEE